MSTTIGTPVSRVDGIAKVTGQARYAAEFTPKGTTYAVIVETTTSAGEIKAIDTTAAEKVPGVILVLTHKNSDKLPYLQPAEQPAVDPVSSEQLHVLQDASVVYCASVGVLHQQDDSENLPVKNTGKGEIIRNVF